MREHIHTPLAVIQFLAVKRGFIDNQQDCKMGKLAM